MGEADLGTGGRLHHISSISWLRMQGMSGPYLPRQCSWCSMCSLCREWAIADAFSACVSPVGSTITNPIHYVVFLVSCGGHCHHCLQ